MKKIAVVLILITALLAVVIPTSAITGGEDDDTHTNVGAIVMYWPQFDITGRLCTATLIHPQMLVTAAHCIKYIENQGIGFDEVWVTFNQDANFGDPYNDSEYLDVETITAHPMYGDSTSPFNDDPSQTSYDVALVILEDPVPDDFGIVPEALPSPSFMDGILPNAQGKGPRDMEMIIVGYGASEVLDAGENQLDAFRRWGIVAFDSLTPLQIITYQNANSGYACTQNGDSGGPLYYVDVQGTETMVGLLSWGTGGMGHCTINGYYTRLDIPEILSFIEDNLP